MKSYKICNLIVNMDLKYSMIRDRAEKYLTDYTDNPDVIVDVKDKSMVELENLAPYLSVPE